MHTDKVFMVLWRRCFGCLCVLLIFPSLSHAQTLGLEVRPADQELLSQEPRRIVTVAFLVRNGIGRAGQFEAHPILPQGWRLITPEYHFDLADGETQVRYISFFIPAGARAGDYELTYRVNDRQQPAINDAYTLPVRILPVLKLEVSSLDVPVFVISGETYRATFLIQNRGNAPITVEYKVRSSRGTLLEPETGTLTLDPGESKPLEARVKTDAFRKPEQDWLSLTTRVTGTTITDNVTSRIRLIPRVTGFEQRYNTIPSTFSLKSVVQDNGDARGRAWQTEITGGGAIDQSGKRHIDFLLRGPDLRDKSTLGTVGEYRFDYWDEHLTLSLGDQVYSLSPLSENSRYGDGAGVGYQADQW